MNLTITIPDKALELSINGEPHLLIKRAALEALLPTRAAGDRTTRTPAARAASPRTSRPAPKKLKAPASKPAARAAAAPKPEVSKPESGALRTAVLMAITANPGATSLEIWDRIKQQIPTTPSGSCYTAIKSWVAKGIVEGRSTEAGPKGWFPVRSARKAADCNKITLDGPGSHPNAPGTHLAPSGSAEARGAA